MLHKVKIQGQMSEELYKIILEFIFDLKSYQSYFIFIVASTINLPLKPFVIIFLSAQYGHKQVFCLKLILIHILLAADEWKFNCHCFAS